MKRELVDKRKKLLTRLTRNEYNAYRQFVEKIYLEDYELKILMARKFSNLFISLLELAMEENGGRVRHIYEEKYGTRGKEPIIISNRALAFMKPKIVSGEIKRILLADDIVIHGRTLNKVYEQLRTWFKDAGIQDYTIEVYAYAESGEGLLNVPALENRHTEIVCTQAEWHNISNQIVDIFYLMGQPYTSYVPNYRVREEHYNFSQHFLGKAGSEQAVKRTLDLLSHEKRPDETEVYSPLNHIIENDAGIKELNGILDDVIEKNLDRSEHAAGNWVSGDRQKEVLQAVMGKFFVENGRLDEERCKNLELERNAGIPLYSLIHKLLEKFQSEKSIFASILYAIDFGKGSIVAKKYGNYYVSFIHAGEQNYKYYENHYFPFLYGLYSLETAGLHKGISTVEKKKSEFINEYLQYWKQEQLYYLDTDINYIKEISVGTEYDKVILYDLLDYTQNPHLQHAIKLVQQKVMEL